MTWSWALKNENDVPYIDYHLAPVGGGSFKNPKNNKIINYSSRNFIDKIFRRKKLSKIYDIISVIRPVHSKNLRHLFTAANKLFNKKIYYSFLVIFPMDSDKEFYNSKKKFFYINLINDYNYYIKKYRKYFTLLPIHSFDHEYSLSKEQMCNFYNLSKISILPSSIEGGNRAIHEALLCGCPVMYYKYVVGGVADYMNKSYSVSYASEKDLPNKIIFAMKNYKKFKFNEKKIKYLLSEKYQIPKFKKILRDIYKKDGNKFDEKIDLSELDRKLDGHKLNLPKNLSAGKFTNNLKNFSSFYKYLCILLDKRPNRIKIITIIIFERIFFLLKYLKYEIYNKKIKKNLK